jgi:threonine synthase
VISVPSGNFGNICAGLLAHQSGLPVKHFIAACNANDVIPSFLRSGNYLPQKSVSTLSNAMDVGNPSNFIRILELFNHHSGELKKILSAYSISDEETRATIRKVFLQTKYRLDPHGAVGYAALEKYLSGHEQLKGLFLETAHPAKFINTVESETGVTVPVPTEVAYLFHKKKKSILIEAEYEALKSFLMKRTT